MIIFDRSDFFPTDFQNRSKSRGYSILRYRRMLSAMISKIDKIKFNTPKPGVRNVLLT
jgi:hypothetical protein